MRTHLLSILLSILMTACGVNNGNSAIPTNVPDFPENPPSPPAQTPPSSSGSSSSGGGSSSPSYKTYPTTTGGYFGFTATTTMTLTSSQMLEGFTTDATNKYLLVYENDNGGIYRWYVFSKALTDYTNPNYATVCSFLDDGKFVGSLQADSQYFYIVGKSGSSSSATYTLRRFKRSDCSEAAALATAINPYYSGNPFMYGNVWLSQNSLYLENPVSSDPLGVVNLTTGLYNSFSIANTMGTQKLQWSQAFTGNSAGLWVVSTSSSYSPYFWKLDLSGKAIGWAQLPTSDYSDLNYYEIGFVANSSSNSLVIVTNTELSGGYLSWGGTIRMFYTDVSHF